MSLSGRTIAALVAIPALAATGLGTAFGSDLVPNGETAAEPTAEVVSAATSQDDELKRLRSQIKRERTAHSAQLRRLSGQLVRERRSHKKALQSNGRSDAVSQAIRLAAVAHGVSESRLRSVARCESTFNPHATNGPYLGLFQFGAPLWNQTPYRNFSRTDPYAASQAAAWAFARGWAGHWGCA
jgi:soluble lytic murein transglycosylase-like protein